MDKETKKMKKMFFRNIDKIRGGAIKVSKKWGFKTTISITVLDALINNSKLKQNGDNKDLHKFIDDYNNVILDLLNVCKSACKKMGVKNISYNFCDNCVGIIKSNFEKGLKQAA